MTISFLFDSYRISGGDWVPGFGRSPVRGVGQGCLLFNIFLVKTMCTITHKTAFTSAFVKINLAFELPWLLDPSPTLLGPAQRFPYESKCSFSSIIQILQLNCLYSWWGQLLWCVFSLLGHEDVHNLLLASGHFTDIIQFTMPTLLARTIIMMLDRGYLFEA